MNTPFSFCLFLSLSFSFPLCFLLTCFLSLFLSLSPLRFSLWHKERRIAPSFGSNVPLRTSTRVQTRFHASDVDLVARSLERASRVTSVEGLRLAFPTRIALRVSYQNRVTNPAPDAAESFERIKVVRLLFFLSSFPSFSRPLGVLHFHLSIISFRFSIFTRNLFIEVYYHYSDYARCLFKSTAETTTTTTKRR